MFVQERPYLLSTSGIEERRSRGIYGVHINIYNPLLPIVALNFAAEPTWLFAFYLIERQAYLKLNNHMYKNKQPNWIMQNMKGGPIWETCKPGFFGWGVSQTRRQTVQAFHLFSFLILHLHIEPKTTISQHWTRTNQQISWFRIQNHKKDHFGNI